MQLKTWNLGRPCSSQGVRAQLAQRTAVYSSGQHRRTHGAAWQDHLETGGWRCLCVETWASSVDILVPTMGINLVWYLFGNMLSLLYLTIGVLYSTSIRKNQFVPVVIAPLTPNVLVLSWHLYVLFSYLKQQVLRRNQRIIMLDIERSTTSSDSESASTASNVHTYPPHKELLSLASNSSRNLARV